ncbi:hypothetical protein OC846_006884, partial [Tilletia horrida]
PRDNCLRDYALCEGELAQIIWNPLHPPDYVVMAFIGADDSGAATAAGQREDTGKNAGRNVALF